MKRVTYLVELEGFSELIHWGEMTKSLQEAVLSQLALHDDSNSY